MTDVIQLTPEQEAENASEDNMLRAKSCAVHIVEYSSAAFWGEGKFAKFLNNRINEEFAILADALGYEITKKPNSQTTRNPK